MMEFAIALLLVVISVIVLWLVRRRFVEHTILSRHGISGPKPDLLFGNIYHLKQDRVEVMSKWVRQYGKHFGYYVGGTPVIVCTDVDTLRQIFVKESANFPDRPVAAVGGEPFDSSIIFLKGDTWKSVRNALTPSFSAVKMRLMTGIMQDCVTTFVDLIVEKARAGTTFDMTHAAQGVTLDVISKCALAMDVDCQRSEGGLRTLVRDFLEKAENDAVDLALAFPFLKPAFRVMYHLLASGGMIKSIIGNLEHVIRLRRSGQVPKQPDMLQLMLDAQQSSKGRKLTNQQVISNAFIFLLAGVDTSATALSFVAHTLAKRPDVQDRIVEEARREFPDKMAADETLNYEELHALKYLDQVINECLRIYPPVVLFVTRACLRTCTINGRTFPAGSHVMAPVYQLHHDAELWDQPDEFRPERFSANAERPIHPAQYLPFGLGPRTCIGVRFATLEIKMAVVELLRKVRLEPGDGFKTRPEFTVPTVILTPKGGVPVRAKCI